MIYLDDAATTPVRREAIDAMWPYLTAQFGNPSSASELGASASAALADARAALATTWGCRASEIIFTSGGSEANNLAVKGIALGAPRGRHVVASAIEHESVLEAIDYLVRLHGFTSTLLDVDPDGLVQPRALADELERHPSTALVSIMTANNEVGSVQPIAELAAIAGAHSVPFHTDAVQAADSLRLGRHDNGGRPSGSWADATSVSGHKLGAPKGVGALILRGGIALEPLVHGGGQERGRRSGTENVAGAVALAAAVRAAGDESRAVLDSSDYRDGFIDAVLTAVPGARLTGHAVRRLPRHASFVIPPFGGEPLLLELERHGVIASSGSACAAGRDEPSHVLLAMGKSPTEAASAIRFSWGRAVTPDELSAAAAALADAVSSLRHLSTAGG